MIWWRIYVKLPPPMLERIMLVSVLVQMVYDSMIWGCHQVSVKVFTIPPWFTVVGLGGLASALLLCHPNIVRIYNYLPWTTSAHLQMHGPMCILREQTTVLIALSVPPLPIQLMAFPVLFVVVNTSMLRKSKQIATFTSRSCCIVRPCPFQHLIHWRRNYCF